jgi:hypothetical protein
VTSPQANGSGANRNLLANAVYRRSARPQALAFRENGTVQKSAYEEAIPTDIPSVTRQAGEGTCRLVQ